jgi:putative transposase
MGRKRREVKAVDTIWEVPDALWREVVSPLLDELYPPAPTGRPRADLRRVLDAVIYQMRTGCQWNRLPPQFGSDSTVHRWFQRFAAAGVFEAVWAALVDACDDLGGVDWRWQAADGVLGKARFGGTRSAKTPRTAASRAPSGAC